ncbi:HEAT repeat domain-containing protein [Runella salmonicolor]|uniref:HEAT repeat domain-containing protein n=1 Tax=Runella salmonicolor TaxID=2950278 RepID=A0ABT1FUJ1_9BACT|nr:HEAT repeat domain-containing protein [Runella salmonicolor]MCP1385441.1 HEAT repeat domain-containing protein [Runella salmonicolor]
MLNEQIITDYLMGHLSEAERIVFEQRLTTDPVLRKEVEELKRVWQDLQNAEAETDDEMDAVFYRSLQGEKMLETTIVALKPQPWLTYLKYAAAVASVVFTFWLGRQTAPTQIEYRTITATPPVSKSIDRQQSLPETVTEAVNLTDQPKKKPKEETISQQIATLRREMKMTQELVILSLLKDQSASERLKGLNYAAALNNPKPAVIQALIKTLREDESLNVRLSTIETLERFKQTDEVKKVLVNQLTQTSEPTEQTTLIETLVRMRVKESLPIFEQLQKDEKVDRSVRLLAGSGIGELAMITD